LQHVVDFHAANCRSRNDPGFLTIQRRLSGYCDG